MTRDALFDLVKSGDETGAVKLARDAGFNLLFAREIVRMVKRDLTSPSSKLKSSREILGMTQAQLAEALDVDPMTISNYERGTRTIPKMIDLAVQYLLRERQREDFDDTEF